LSKPPILVTDNGSSFLARKFQQYIQGSYSQVRTRYRTPEQLGLLEPFHRTLKKEEIYWHTYDSPADAREKLAKFHQRYNEVRPHWALIPQAGGDPVTPEEVYRGRVEVALPEWQSWALAAKRKIEELLEKDAQAGAAA
jgi:transposase InsO family protein